MENKVYVYGQRVDILITKQQYRKSLCIILYCIDLADWQAPLLWQRQKTDILIVIFHSLHLNPDLAVLPLSKGHIATG